jgi:hypothetical protein
MSARTTGTASRRLSTYTNGKPHAPARGRYAPPVHVEDQLVEVPPVVQGRPSAGEFLRKIQQILGHVRLETTTIYVRVAQPTDRQSVTSPLDVMTAG